MDKEKHETMIALVNKWKGSGIPVRTYAQKIGVSKSKFDYWVRKHKSGIDAKISLKEFIQVSPLTENQEQSHDAVSESPTCRPPQIVLTFPSGLCVKIYG